MSVLPSRPLATNRSGCCQPVARRSVSSARSSGQASDPSAQPPQVGHGRQVDPAVGVEVEPPVRRPLHVVGPVGRRQVGESGPVQLDAAAVDEVGVLVRVDAGGAEVNGPFVVVHVVKLVVPGLHDPPPPGHLVQQLPRRQVVPIQVVPAVPLAEPQQLVPAPVRPPARVAVTVDVRPVRSSTSVVDRPVSASTTITRTRWKPRLPAWNRNRAESGDQSASPTATAAARSAPTSGTRRQ